MTEIERISNGSNFFVEIRYLKAIALIGKYVGNGWSSDTRMTPEV